MVMSAESQPCLSGLGWGDHVACLCDTAEERIEVLSSYLRQGLERGEKVRCVIDRETPDALLEAWSFRNDGLEVPRLSGRLSFARFEETLSPDESGLNGMAAWLEAEERLALGEGYSALRVSLEMSWVLGGDARAAELLTFEQGLHSFLKGRKCTVLCQYDRNHFRPALLLYILAVHPKVIHAKEVHDNCYFMASPHLFGEDFPASTLRRWLKELRSSKATLPAETCIHTS